ncbi:MAG: hypothetical protein AAF355_13955 [Myxococcota bacterium]
MNSEICDSAFMAMARRGLLVFSGRASALCLSVLWGLAATGGLAGCSASCPALRFTDPSHALLQHRQQRANARTMRAEARVEQFGGREGRIRGTVMMFVEQPDRVRFDVLSQFGPVMTLSSDGSRFALTDLRENRFLAGRTCPQNIERLLGVAMSGEEVARLLRGEPPRSEGARASLECTRHGGQLLRLHGDDGRIQEIVYEVPERDALLPLSDQRLQLMRSQLFDAQGRTLWRATYADYRDVPVEAAKPVRMPFAVRFIDKSGADTSFYFKEIELNVAIPAGAFVQAPRPGVSVELVACGLET